MHRHIWALSIIIGAVLAAYSNTLRNGFIGDDHIYIENNPFVSDPSNVKHLFDPRFYLGSQEVLVGSRPVFLATLLADRALWGGNPAGYHATNALLHAANSAWVYALSCALELPPPLPLFAGLFFALHPVQTEAVDGVSFRPDLLAAFFVFFSLWTYLKARRAQPGKAAALIASSAGLYGLGLLSKEMAATLPLLVLLAEFYFPETNGRRRRITGALIAYALVAGSYAGFWAPRFHYNGVQAVSSLRTAVDTVAAAMPTAPAHAGIGIGLGKARVYAPSSWEFGGLFTDKKAAALTMIKAVAAYFHLLLDPVHLVVNRAPQIVHGWTEGGVLFCLAALLLIAFYAAWARRRDPASSFGAAWCLTALLPAYNIIPLYNPVAERYLYLVTTGAALVAASAVAWLARQPGPRKREKALILGGILAASYGARTFARNFDWRSERTLYLGAVADGPQNSRAYLTRGSLLQEDGRFADAASEYEQAVRLDPGFPEAWLGLGACYGEAGQMDKATASFDKALALAPKNPTFPFNYAIALSRAGRFENAASMYRRALELDPQCVQAWVNLGELYRGTKHYAQSRTCLRKALALAEPGDAMPRFSYGTLLEDTGDRKGAARQYRAALEQDSTFAPARQGLERLGNRQRTQRTTKDGR